MATYGEGDPTDNAHELNEWLQNEQDLEGVNYAVSIYKLSQGGYSSPISDQELIIGLAKAI